MRGIRDGHKVDFDVDEPDVEGVLPASEATVGEEEVVVDEPGRREVVLCDIDALAITEIQADVGASSPASGTEDRLLSFLVLDGEVEFGISGAEIRAPAGTWLQVPPEVSSALSLRSIEPSGCLALHGGSA